LIKKKIFPLIYDTDPRSCEICKYSLAAFDGIIKAAKLNHLSSYSKECNKKAEPPRCIAKVSSEPLYKLKQLEGQPKVSIQGTVDINSKVFIEDEKKTISF